MSEIMYEPRGLLLSTAAWVGGLAGVVATQSARAFQVAAWRLPNHRQPVARDVFTWRETGSRGCAYHNSDDERWGWMKTTGDSERQVWAATLLATGQTDVFGAVRRSPRLHWSFDGAKLEAEGWAEEMSAGPIAWARIENEIAVGRIKGHAVVLRSILLPLGPPPA